MRDNGFFDQGPMNVTGAVTARKARVMHKDGHLYVFTTPKHAHILETSTPVQLGENWTAETPDGQEVSFTRRGCSSCGWGLGKYSAPDLLAAVE